jgi:hypothetical protein
MPRLHNTGILQEKLKSTPRACPSVCLRYLSFYVFAVSCKEGEPTQVMEKLFPLLNYAAHFWGQHASTNPGTDTVTELANKVLCNDKMVNLVWNITDCYDHARHISSSLHLCTYYGLEHLVELLIICGIVPDSTTPAVALHSPGLPRGDTQQLYGCCWQETTLISI